METTGARPEDLDPAQQLRELERAEALPFVVYPETPRWYMPAMGLYFGGLVASFGLFDSHTALFTGAVLLLTVFVGVVVGIVKARYGAFPKVSKNAPPEIREAYRRYFIGLPVVVVLAAVAWLWAGPVVAGIATFVLVTGAVVLYENYYAQAAAHARARLGIEAA